MPKKQMSIGTLYGAVKGKLAPHAPHRPPLGNRPVLAKGFLGYVEAVTSRSIAGWVMDRGDLAIAPKVAILVGDDVVAVVTPDGPRVDVTAAHGVTAPCGFRFEMTPERGGLGSILSAAAIDAGLAETLTLACEQRDRHFVDQPIVLDKVLQKNVAVFRRLENLPRIKEELAEAKSGRNALVPTINYTLFEITDLVMYLKHHNTVTGIQRTECGFIAGLFSKAGTHLENLRFCSVSEHYPCVTVFKNDQVRQLVDDVFSGKSSVPELTLYLEKMFQDGIDYTPKRGDNLLILGAYWIIPNIENRLYQLKKTGVTIGTYVYDIIPISSPQWVENVTAIVFVERAPGVISLSDYVITISEYVKKDVERLIRAELSVEKPIGVTPLPHQVISSNERKPVSKDGLSKSNYVLCVCTLEVRKNHIILYRVWAGLIRKYGWARVPTLVLIGRWGWRMEDFREACERSNNLGGKIVIRSGVHDEELKNLYEGCLFTVFPSFTEGWGLPVGESLYLGKYCVASSLSSIPEVGGEYVDYLDPYDYENAFCVIERAIYDDAYREARERAIVEGFKPRTWEDLASNLITIARALGDQTVAAPSPDIPVPPRLQVGRVYDLAGLSRSETISWLDKQVRFAFATGWHTLESWGLWSSTPNSRVLFKTDLAAGASVKVWLKISLPNRYLGEQIGVMTDGRYRSLVDATADLRPGWYSFEATIDKDQITSFEICRPRSSALRELPRELYVGVSGFAYCLAGDTMTENAMLRFISDIKLVGI